MPLTKKGSKIMESMKAEYGPEKAKRVFYASRNKGTISGVEGVTVKRKNNNKRRFEPDVKNTRK